MDKPNGLTPEQDGILQQFQAVTQNEDVNASINTLDAYEWNLERAVSSFFDASSPTEKDEAGPSTSKRREASSSTHRSESSRATNGSSRSNDPRPLPSRPQANSLHGLLTRVLAYIALSINRLLALIPYFFFARQSITASSQPSRTERDPATLAQRFLIEFEESYGRTHPNFHQGGYTSALGLAKREGRFFVVILLSSEHDSTHEFCSATLQNSELLSYLDQHQILVWGGNVRESEAFQVSTTLQATTYPFLALITLTNASRGSGSTAPKMSVVDRIEGLSTPDEIQRRIQNAINRYGGLMEEIRRERAERDSARRLRDEQDAAYQASLRQDRDRERKARLAKEAEERVERERRAEEERQLKLAQDREAYRRWLVSQVPPEPKANEKEVARLSFRMRDGQRVVRKFGPDATVETLYAFVDSYPYFESSSSGPSSPPDGYSHAYDFQIVSPFPRTVFDPSNAIIREDTALWPSASLVVESLEETED